MKFATLQEKKCPRWVSASLSILDESTEPCSNFYQFACGGYISRENSSEFRKQWMDEGIEKQKNKFEDILNSTILESDSPSIKKAKKFYKSCENLPAEYPPYMFKVANHLMSKVYAVRHLSDKMNHSLEERLANYELIGLDQYIATTVGIKPLDTSQRIIQVKLLSVRDNMKKVETNLTLDEEGVEKIYAVTQYKKQLIYKTFSKKLPENTAERQITLKEADNMMRDFNLTKYVEIILGKITNGSVVVKPDDEIILVDNYNASATLGSFLRDMRKNKEVFKDVIGSYEGYEYICEKDVSGLCGHKVDKKHFCFDQTEKLMGLPVAAMLIKKQHHRIRRAARRVKKMYENIRDSFVESMNASYWASRGTREAAVEKINNIMAMIGYPDYMDETPRKHQNMTEIDRYFEEVSIDPGSYDDEDSRMEAYIRNVDGLMINGRRKDIESIHKPVSRLVTYYMTYTQAFYSPIKNGLSVPFGYFHLPQYSGKRAEFMNYGTTGFTIGHEMTHSVDNKGGKHDKTGNKINWWSEDSAEHFKKKSDEMVKEYSKLVYHGQKIDGNRTLSENIADLGGLKLAFKGLKKWQKTQKMRQSKRTDGLNKWSEEKLFFLSFAQEWCTREGFNPDHLDDIVNDEHMPPRLRIMMTLKNFDEFGKAWECKKGDPMYPEKTLGVW